jgi:hypothetical protein
MMVHGYYYHYSLQAFDGSTCLPAYLPDKPFHFTLQRSFPFEKNSPVLFGGHGVAGVVWCPEDGNKRK